MDDERIDALVAAAEELPATPTTKHTASDVMKRRGFNPFDKMIDLYEQIENAAKTLSPDTPIYVESRLKILAHLSKYHSAQPKAVDVNIHSHHTGGPAMTVLSFNDTYEARKAMIPPQSIYDGPKLMGVTEIVEAEVVDSE